MGTLGQRRFQVAVFVVILGLMSGFVWRVGAQMPVSLAPAGAVTPAAPTSHPAFGALPEVPVGSPTTYPGGMEGAGGRVHAGTNGRALPEPQKRSGVTFAILGDRTSGEPWGLTYLQKSVDELNLLRPDLVLTIGDQVQGYNRSGEAYVKEAAEYRKIVDQLTMPWYPTAGNHDVIAGTRDPKDHRFEELYQKNFGPLYYSVDYADLHFVVLYSEEQLQSEPKLSDAQLAWLKRDLEGTFARRVAAGGGGHVFVLVHKPMWRYEKANWGKVHEMLAEFNRRPVVTIEQPAGAIAPPKVEAVYAGHLHAYSDEGAKDGIGYYVLGPTGASIDQDRITGQMEHYTLVKVDALGPKMALVEPGSIQPDSFVTAVDRAVFEKIGKIDDKTIGVIGTLDQPVGKAVGTRNQEGQELKLVVENPLKTPMDVAVRLASTRFLNTAVQRATANMYTDNYDSPWELYVPYATMHLEPGQKLAYKMGLYIAPQPGEVPPPQVEFLVTVADSKGRAAPTLLKRRVPLVPAATLPTAKGAVTTAGGEAKEDTWDDAVKAGTYAFVPSMYDKAIPNPELQMLADEKNVYIRVRTADKVASYYPNFAEPWNLPSDAVAVEFAPTAETANEQVQRIVVLPFGEKGPVLLTNNGVGKAQTALLPLDTKAHPATAVVKKSADGWDCVIAIPRKIVFGAGDAAVMNVVVTNNDDTYHSETRSWAREDLGPKGWGRVKVGK